MSNTMTKTGVLVRSLCAIFFSFVSHVSVAETLPVYPNATLERSEQGSQQSHPIIVNRMKKVNGAVISDDARWLNGELSRTLYQLPQGQSSESGYDFFIDKFAGLGVKELFSCRSFSCGESNFWANDIFNIALLYGQNRQQLYFMGEKQGVYYSVYSVQRGNGRIYTLVDVFTSDKKGVSTSLPLEQLDARGFHDLYISSPFKESESLSSLKKTLKENPGLKVILQLRVRVPASLTDYDQQTADLLQQGQQIKSQLVDGGVDASRFRVEISVETSVTAGLSAHKMLLRIFSVH